MIEFYQVNFCKIIGDSYGLSLAIADKLSRIYTDIYADQNIIATGKINYEQKVEAIGFFQQKLEFILKQIIDDKLRSGDVFFIAKENLDIATNTEKKIVSEIKNHGIKIYPVKDLTEVNNISEEEGSDSEPEVRLIKKTAETESEMVRMISNIKSKYIQNKKEYQYTITIIIFENERVVMGLIHNFFT